MPFLFRCAQLATGVLRTYGREGGARVESWVGGWAGDWACEPVDGLARAQRERVANEIVHGRGAGLGVRGVGCDASGDGNWGCRPPLVLDSGVSFIFGYSVQMNISDLVAIFKRCFWPLCTSLASLVLTDTLLAAR